jgi:hypothetical protein
VTGQGARFSMAAARHATPTAQSMCPTPPA